MTYSEGNTYTPIQKWTTFTRPHDNASWIVLAVVTEDPTEKIRELNAEAGWQKFALAQHTI